TSLNCVSTLLTSTISVVGRVATVSNLGAGDTVTCDYVNTGTSTIIVRKKTIGGIGAFSFTTTGSGLAAFPITTVVQNTFVPQTFNNLTSGATGGSRTVTESGPPAGFAFTSLSCSAAGASTFSTSGQVATISNLA